MTYLEYVRLVANIQLWVRKGWKEGWFNKRKWSGDDEIAASLQSYLVKVERKRNLK